jgi:hypothetical protein
MNKLQYRTDVHLENRRSKPASGPGYSRKIYLLCDDPCLRLPGTVSEESIENVDEELRLRDLRRNVSQALTNTSHQQLKDI